MGIGNELIGGVEHLLLSRTISQRSLFRMIGNGSHSFLAERDLQGVFPNTRCLLLPSASVGLELILEALDLPAGGEVLIAPFGWVSNWSCVYRAGLVPRFLPLDESLQLRADVVAKYFGDHTVAVIVTHLMGRGQQDAEEIAKLCAERQVVLLEDVAQSFGVAVNGRRVGTFGEAAWCSLNHHKVLSTGDGGFVAIRDVKLYERVCALHDQGCVLRNGRRRPAEPLEPGLSLRVSELVAAVFRGQLARFNFVRNRVWRLHNALSEACVEHLGLELIGPNGGDIPFTVLFRRRPGLNHPSLAESGWHVADNVPWLRTAYAEAADADAELASTLERLAGVGAVGSGFVDAFYSTPYGLRITDQPEHAKSVVNRLEKL